MQGGSDHNYSQLSASMQPCQTVRRALETQGNAVTASTPEQAREILRHDIDRYPRPGEAGLKPE